MSDRRGILLHLLNLFPDKRVTVDVLALYERYLADVSVEELREATVEVAQTSRFFPSLAEIREVVAHRRLGLPDEAEALAAVERYVAARPERVLCEVCAGAVGETPCPACRDEGSVPAPAPPLHPAVREALELVGGREGYLGADAPSVVRGQLLKLYREIREREMRVARVGSLALATGPQRRELATTTEGSE